MLKAANLASQTLMRKAISHWKTYIQERKAKSELHKVADQVRQITLLRTCWGKWREKMCSLRNENNQLREAVKAYDLSLMHKV